MKRSSTMFAAIVLVAIALAVLELGAAASEPYACPQLEAGWGTFNLLQAQQTLRIVAAFMTAC